MLSWGPPRPIKVRENSCGGLQYVAHVEARSETWKDDA